MTWLWEWQHEQAKSSLYTKPSHDLTKKYLRNSLSCYLWKFKQSAMSVPLKLKLTAISLRFLSVLYN